MILTTEDSQERVFLRAVWCVEVGALGIVLESGAGATGDLAVP